MLKIGDKAPEFSLKDENLKEVSISDFKGKSNLLVLFFPLVNTGVCEKELCSIRDGLHKFSSVEAQVLAISVDSSFAHRLWKDKQKFNFPLLSDFNKEVCKAYGAFYDVFAPGALDYRGVAKRSAFVIDKDGILRYAEVLEDASEEPNYGEIKKCFDQL